jgi:hypothetical protein
MGKLEFENRKSRPELLKLTSGSGIMTGRELALASWKQRSDLC